MPGLSGKVQKLEETVRRLQGRLQGPPWFRMAEALPGETREQTFDRLGLEEWERPSTGTYVLEVVEVPEIPAPVLRPAPTVNDRAEVVKEDTPPEKPPEKREKCFFAAETAEQSKVPRRMSVFEAIVRAEQEQDALDDL